jgi:hypothetical protein
MNAAKKYEQLALDCVNLAEAARDPATQDRLLQLAGFCARLADNAQSEPDTGFWSEEIRPPNQVPASTAPNPHARG